MYAGAQVAATTQYSIRFTRQWQNSALHLMTLQSSQVSDVHPVCHII